MEESIDIASIILKEMRGEATHDELDKLNTWRSQDPSNLATYQSLQSHEYLLNKHDQYQAFNKEKIWNQLSNDINPVRSIYESSYTFLKYAASIILPLVISFSLVYFLLLKPANDQRLSSIDKEVTPGTEVATLILSDGKTVSLSETQPAKMINEENTNITLTKNQLLYEQSETIEEESHKPLKYNELITPKGGRYTVSLADGTNVILNADAKVRYPVEFSDSVRQVYLEGEAYFDVAHSGSPFIVTTGQQNIRVLGTKFNVSAYSDDVTVSTTLIEGSVRVEVGDNTAVLTPGEQAILEKDNLQVFVSTVNTAQFISWTSGNFDFSNETIESVMKTLSRWYDFAYRFENQEAKQNHFTGRVGQQQPISSILKMLEATSEMKFEYKNKTIIIK